MAMLISRRFRPILTSPGERTRRLLSSKLFCVNPEVKDAVSSNWPVVALESTILTHGMPYPDNIRMARSVERIVRENGAVPATIALINGRAYVGLSDQQLEEVADPKSKAVKVSRRDLAVTLNKGLVGGTTISGTMVLAEKAGIKIFVSGGLGGVHHGGEISMDVSADLTELGRTPVAVITSGVKSILDIGRTLEYLETQGVCVTTFGQTTDFPAFFTSKSGYHSPSNVTTIEEAADLIHTTLQLQLQTGLLIAVPIPKEYELEGEVIAKHIQAALKQAREKNITGRQVTPFVLDRVNSLSLGQSLQANIALVKNNARIGAHVAVSLAERLRGSGFVNFHRFTRSYSTTNTDITSTSSTTAAPRPVVIGACNLDTVLHLQDDNILYNGATNRAISSTICGGVGRNLSDALCRLGSPNNFLTALGQDLNGDKIIQQCKHMDWNLARRLAEESTATYTVVLNTEGDVCLGIGDMVIHDRIDAGYITENEDQIKKANMVVMDGNISVDAMKAIHDICMKHSKPIFYEPTDLQKATKPLLAGMENSIRFIKPNLLEMAELYKMVTGNELHTVDKNLEEITAACAVLTKLIPNILVTLGKDGVLFCSKNDQNGLNLAKGSSRNTKCWHHDDMVCIQVEARSVNNVKSLSGAGDCLAAGFIHGILSKQSIPQSMLLGIQAASLSVQSYDTIPNTLHRLRISPI